MKRSFGADTLILKTIFVSVAVMLFALPAFAQSVDATVNGTTKDQAGAIVSGTTVTLIDKATRRETSVKTNTDGFYVFQNVRPGMYSLRAQHYGFETQEVAAFKVDVATPAKIGRAHV